jgi:hypothetical protein
VLLATNVYMLASAVIAVVDKTVEAQQQSNSSTTE